MWWLICVILGMFVGQAKSHDDIRIDHVITLADICFNTSLYPEPGYLLLIQETSTIEEAVDNFNAGLALLGLGSTNSSVRPLEAQLLRHLCWRTYTMSGTLSCDYNPPPFQSYTQTIWPHFETLHNWLFQ